MAFTRDAVYRYRFRDGVVLAANEGLVNILDLGGHPGDVIGRPLRELLHYTEPEGVLRQAIADAGSVRGLEYHFKTLKGEDRWVVHDSFMIDPGESGEKEVVAIARDITQQKLVETALRDSERRYRHLFEESPVSLWLEDFSAVKAHIDKLRAAGVSDIRAHLKGHPGDVIKCASLVRVVAVNQATLKLYRAETREDLLCNLHNVFTEESIPAFRDQLIALAEGHTDFSSEAVNKDLAGQRKVISLKWIVAPGHETAADQVLVAITDITDLKNAQEAFEAMNADLEQRVRTRTRELQAANSELEAFAYSVSHDLRAPLRSIEGFSRALQEDCADALGQTGGDHLRRVRAAAQRMNEYIESMLRLSRASRAQITLVPVDLAETARAVAQDLTRSASEREVEWILPDWLIADGDPRLLETVVRNLLENAWKFTSKRPHARIEMAVCDSPPPVSTPLRGITFMVRDNGVGFDMTYAPKLFAAFQRLHSAEEFPGAGIGLATVRRIVHRHGGLTWAEGAPNAGATFYVWLPFGRERETDGGPVNGTPSPESRA